MKVKICGTTNLKDAILSSEVGADYLGFIFYPPSKRSIDVPTAGKITAVLRQHPNCPILVGVFVNETADHMAHILDRCQLDLAQLHGDEIPAMIGDEHSPLYGRAYKALRPTSLTEAEAEAEWYIPPPSPHLPISQSPNLLIDTYHPTLRGGTGQTTDWQLSARLVQQFPGLMLAGGLTPENVGEAVRMVRPFGLDVASGVESTPGQKDPAKVYTFIHNAKSVG
ncbi:MAG: phosphoribosylanthranilate isomerase [Chloroflexi bacterium]|nr:phosphoribosylanthranilate isomerase [Chloroflexota bacterium]